MKLGPETLNELELTNLNLDFADIKFLTRSDGTLRIEVGSSRIDLSPYSRKELESFLLPLEERRDWDKPLEDRFDAMLREILEARPECFIRLAKLGQTELGGRTYEAGFWIEASRLYEPEVTQVIQSLVYLFPNTLAITLAWGPGADSGDAEVIWERPLVETQLITEER